MWIPPEDIDPVVLHEPTRKNLGLFGAVSVFDGRMVTAQEQKFNAMTFQSFLKHLLQHRRDGHKMVVILDNARWHHANLLKPWLEENRQILRLDFLPPYSPELNGIERVWKLTRTLCTHNRYFPTLNELRKVVSEQFELWRAPNKILSRLCAII
jgi:transposase